MNTSLISTNLRGNNKEEIIDELLDLIMKSGKVQNRAAAREAVLKRERLMSTGLQAGLAIPHGKTDAVAELATCIGIKKEGLDFQSIDQEPSKIFIMTLSPLHFAGPHVQFLAEICELMRKDELRQRILNAESPNILFKILTENEK